MIRSAVALAVAFVLSLTGAPVARAGMSGGKSGRTQIPLDPAPDCTVTVTGAVRGTFRCKVDARPLDATGLRLGFTPVGLPRQIGAFLAGPFKVPAPAQAKTYLQGDLAEGRAALSARRATYAAQVGKASRGAVKLVLTKVEVSPHGDVVARGTMTARLVREGGSGREAVVTVRF